MYEEILHGLQSLQSLGGLEEATPYYNRAFDEKTDEWVEPPDVVPKVRSVAYCTLAGVGTQVGALQRRVQSGDTQTRKRTSSQREQRRRLFFMTFIIGRKFYVSHDFFTRVAIATRETAPEPLLAFYSEHDQNQPYALTL